MKKIDSNTQYFEESFNKLNVPLLTVAKSEFEECEFNDCDFSEAFFERCKFINCSFNHCNLSLLKLSYSSLFAVSFTECKLVGVDFTKAHWPTFNLDAELKFTQCILNDASFFGLTLQELQLNQCKLHDVDFREGDFSHSVMRYCDFTNSLFMRTNLQGVDFTESIDFYIDVLEKNVAKAKFSRHEALSLLDGLGIELVD